MTAPSTGKKVSLFKKLITIFGGAPMFDPNTPMFQRAKVSTPVGWVQPGKTRGRQPGDPDLKDYDPTEDLLKSANKGVAP